MKKSFNKHYNKFLCSFIIFCLLLSLMILAKIDSAKSQVFQALNDQSQSQITGGILAIQNPQEGTPPLLQPPLSLNNTPAPTICPDGRRICHRNKPRFLASYSDYCGAWDVWNRGSFYQILRNHQVNTVREFMQNFPDFWAEDWTNPQQPFTFVNQEPILNQIFFNRVKDMLNNLNQRNMIAVLTLSDTCSMNEARKYDNPLYTGKGGILENNSEIFTNEVFLDMIRQTVREIRQMGFNNIIYEVCNEPYNVQGINNDIVAFHKNVATIIDQEHPGILIAINAPDWMTETDILYIGGDIVTVHQAGSPDGINYDYDSILNNLNNLYGYYNTPIIADDDGVPHAIRNNPATFEPLLQAAIDSDATGFFHKGTPPHNNDYSYVNFDILDSFLDLLTSDLPILQN